jgi:hypothetical protein
MHPCTGPCKAGVRQRSSTAGDVCQSHRCRLAQGQTHLPVGSRKSFLYHTSMSQSADIFGLRTAFRPVTPFRMRYDAVLMSPNVTGSVSSTTGAVDDSARTASSKGRNDTASTHQHKPPRQAHMHPDELFRVRRVRTQAAAVPRSRHASQCHWRRWIVPREERMQAREITTCRPRETIVQRSVRTAQDAGKAGAGCCGRQGEHCTGAELVRASLI